MTKRRETWATYDKTCDRSLPVKLRACDTSSIRRGVPTSPVIRERGGSVSVELLGQAVHGYTRGYLTMSKRAARLLGRALLKHSKVSP